LPLSQSAWNIHQQNGKQEEHRYRTRIHQHLYGGQKFRPQLDIRSTDAKEGQEQEQRRMHDVPAGNHHDRRGDAAQGKEKEKEVHTQCPLRLCGKTLQR
jgi:hypothetical protein